MALSLPCPRGTPPTVIARCERHRVTRLPHGAAGCASVRTVIAERLSWPLIGRDEELAFARRRLAARPAGGLVVAGEPGVGKTRLASEIAGAAADDGRRVRWVRATRSASSIPLGAFAALLPPPDQAAGLAELLARARHALLCDGRPIVLCIDDAQLLDDASATLAHQLVAAGDAFVVATIRAGERAPDAVQALWKDELCALVELEALGRDTLALLVAEALGGPLDGRGLNVLAELTRGNPLFVRELVHHGVEHGVLTQDGGIWRWRGEPALGLRLTELVATRLADLPQPAHDVLELVAVGAPLEVGLLDDDEIRALEILEPRGLVERVATQWRRYVDVAHPVHGEVIRARLGRTRLERIQLRLADAVAGRGARRRLDVLRVAGWRLECGVAVDGDTFVRAAEQALALLDWPLAERFAGAATRAGGGFGARVALARALAGSGRAVDAEALLGTLEREAADDAARRASRSPARATCSGAWIAPARPTRSCATPKPRSPTPACATSSSCCEPGSSARSAIRRRRSAPRSRSCDRAPRASRPDCARPSRWPRR